MSRQWRSLTLPLAVVRGGSQAVELVAWVLLARRLGATEFGELSVAFLVSRWFGLVADWGAAQYGSRDVAAGATEKVAHLQARRTEITIGCSVLFIAGALVSGSGVVAPLALVIIASGMTWDWVAVGEGRGVAASVPSAVRALLLVAMAAYVVTLSGAVMAVALAYLGWFLCSLSLNRRGTWLRHGWERIEAPPWGLVIVLGAQVYTTLDVLLLNWIEGPTDAGVYNAVYRFPLGISTVVGLMVTGLLPPLTSELQSGRMTKLAARRHLLVIGVLGGVSVLAMIPLFVLITPWLFGQEYADGTSALVILMIATAVSTVTAPTGALLLATGHERPIAIAVLAGAVLNLVGNLVLIPILGLVGAATTTVLSEALVLSCQLVMLRNLGHMERIRAD